MEGAKRDSTEEWLVPEERRPLSVAELEQRVDQALSVARSAEVAALEIGAVAIESAEQAKRAAELALKASELATRGGDGEGAAVAAAANGAAARPVAPHGEDRLISFSRRADRLCERFVRLQRR